MSQINLNVQGIDSAASIEIIAKALGPFGDVKNIHVDWESGRVQVTRPSNRQIECGFGGQHPRWAMAPPKSPPPGRPWQLGLEVRLQGQSPGPQ